MISPLVRRLVATFAALLGLLVGLLGVDSRRAEASDTITRWEHFSESSNCSDPYTKTPYMSRAGYLGDQRTILGPFGTYFGRTIGDVRSQVVPWTVPFSGGRSIMVHKAALPSFQQVAETLEDHAEWGRVYWISSVGGFYPRTISGSYQLSRHGLGTAIDMNPPRNPYRSDAKLVTDMPTWFVDAWRDAGFCWGGDWEDAKDAMHFSWIGPGAGASAGAQVPLPPRTSLAPFGSIDESRPTVLAPVLDRYSLFIGDATGNGAPDASGVRSHPDGAVLDISQSSWAYDECSVYRWFIDDREIANADFTLLADITGDSRQDLVALHVGGGGVDVQTATRRGEFEDVQRAATTITTDVSAVAAADFDADHIADLWVVSADGSLRVYGGPSWDSVLHSSTLPGGAPDHLAVSDRDGGNLPEVFALYDDGTLQVLRLDGTWEVEQSLDLGTTTYLATGAGDFDGDGRADFQTLDSSGTLDAYMGNTATGRSASSWFVRPDRECEDLIPLAFEGTFYDDDESVHQNGIEFIAGERITVGCNPPFNDQFCPKATLTRAQAATFIARAIKLPPPTADYFDDDTGHVLEGAINRVAQAGLTQGCNPPANNAFCPDRSITRAEFGTLLVRALNLPATSVDYFIDDDGHVLEGAINRLAEAGITQGCNPPLNDRFCPSSLLTRAEAATLLTRAFK